MAIKKEIFRQVMGHFTTGVTVVTTSHNDVIAGLTVNAFCSVSLNPPLVLVCIDNRSNTLTLIRESQVFAVNMLTAAQEQFARGFATNSPERAEHFCYAPHHKVATGSPIIDDVLAFIDARVVQEYPAGDHTIFIGQVEAMGSDDRVTFVNDTRHAQNPSADDVSTDSHTSELPLTYYQGQYRHLTSIYHHPSMFEPSKEESVGESTRSK